MIDEVPPIISNRVDLTVLEAAIERWQWETRLRRHKARHGGTYYTKDQIKTIESRINVLKELSFYLSTKGDQQND